MRETNPILLSIWLIQALGEQCQATGAQPHRKESYAPEALL